MNVEYFKILEFLLKRVEKQQQTSLITAEWRYNWLFEDSHKYLDFCSNEVLLNISFV